MPLSIISLTITELFFPMACSPPFAISQFGLPENLKVPPFSTHGQIDDIVKLFGSAEQLRAAVTELQNSLYAS